MAQKIKQQIKKSMPLFVIVCMLLTTTTIGVVFSYNLEFGAWSKGFLGINIDHPEAQAQGATDDVTTQVRVRNAPPTFSVDTAEVPASTSTSPTNNGDNLDFQATAVDPESNGYWLLVCDAAGASAGAAGAAPSCTVGNQLCVSTASTTSGSVQTCTATISTAAETVDWYSYVCDDHLTEAECSVDYSQGAEPDNYATSSPLYVNHQPTLSAASTTVDSLDPGGTFTVQAYAPDTDTYPAEDNVVMYVCGSNSWDTNGCTGEEFCKGTSTADYITCNFATSSPAADGTFNYWVFVEDEHNFAASGNPQVGTYTVNNVAPTVSSVRLHGSVDITLNIKNAAEVIATTTATISDINTCHDLSDATSSVYYSAVTDEWNCAADDDNCYQIGTAQCEVVAGSCVGTQSNATASCTVALAFHAVPTDGGGGNYPYAGKWYAGIKAIDDDGAVGIGTTSDTYGVEVITSTALSVSEAAIDYLTVTGGQNTGLVNATTTVENYGNSPVDTDLEGTDLVQTGVDYIETENQRFGTSTATYSSLYSALLATTSGAIEADIDVAKPDDDTSLTITDEIYWGIEIPAGRPSGIYNGLNTFTATLDNNDW